MDYATVARTIGKKGTIVLGGLTLEVIVANYKQSYGKDRWLVKPVAGTGEVWVETVTIT